MQSLSARTTLAPTALRRATPARRRPRGFASSASAPPIEQPNVTSPLRAPRVASECPELRALWDEGRPVMEWAGVTVGETSHTTVINNHHQAHFGGHRTRA